MNYIPKINDSTYYLGVNDRTKHLFENIWPLPNGVAYNSYLIRDEKNVLLDTVDVCYSDQFLHSLDQALGGASLDYVIINHMEPDHSGSLSLLRHRYPNVQIVGNKRTWPMLKGFHGICDGLVEVSESEGLNIGSRTLQFVFAPMVHWPEVMFTYDPLEKVLFSADAFGSFGTLDGGVLDKEVDTSVFLDEVYRYYSNIVGKYGKQTQQVLKKAADLEICTICSTHGPVWKEQIADILSLYDRLSRYEGEEGVVVVYGSMYGNTEHMADAVAKALQANGVKKVVLHNLSKSHPSYIIADIFRYKGVVFGSPTYNMEVLPPLDNVLTMLRSRSIPDRKVATFGSGSWNCAAEKKLDAIAADLGWTEVAKPIMMMCADFASVEERIFEMGKEMAKAIKQ